MFKITPLLLLLALQVFSSNLPCEDSLFLVLLGYNA